MTKTEKVLHEDRNSKTVQTTIKTEHAIVKSTQTYSKCYYLNKETEEIDYYLIAR